MNMDYYKIEKEYQDKKNNKQPNKLIKILCILLISIILFKLLK